MALACVDAGLALLESAGESPLLSEERRRLAHVRMVLQGAPSSAHAPVVPARVPSPALGEDRFARLGQATGTMVRRLAESGWFDFAKRELALGRNPARKGWQRILCSHLLSGGVSRSALQLAFEEKLNLKPASARVQVSKAVTVFLAGGLLREVAGRLVINPN